VSYSARTSDGLVFATEMERLAQANAPITIGLRVTGREGRLTRNDIADICRAYPDAEFFVCGPDAFMTDVCGALAAAGVPKTRVRTERFSPAGAPVARKTTR